MGNDQIEDIEDYVAIEGIDGYIAINGNMDPDDFVSANQCIIDLLIDGSGSMCIYEQAMKNCLVELKDAMCNSNQQNELLVSATIFNDTVEEGNYLPPRYLDTSYNAIGCTSLYDAIVQRHDALLQYINECRIKGASVRAYLIIFSDGIDNNSYATHHDASEKIEELLKAEIRVAFIAFGPKAFGIAEGLGIRNNPDTPDRKNVLEVTDSVDNLKEVMRLTSRSAISASRKAIGSGNSEGFFEVD